MKAPSGSTNAERDHPQEYTGTPLRSACDLGDLTEADYQRLAARAINRETADAAGIRRVDAAEGAQLIGRSGRADTSYAGLIIPPHRPGEDRVREFRLRRDKPDLELRADGSTREKSKYMSPPGRGSRTRFR